MFGADQVLAYVHVDVKSLCLFFISEQAYVTVLLESPLKGILILLEKTHTRTTMKKEGEHLQFARRQSSPLHTSFVIALFVRYNLTLY